MEEVAKFWDNVSRMMKGQDKTVLTGTVEKVDEAARTCTMRTGGVTYEDVRLYSVVKPDLKGFCFIPKIGSHILAARIGGSNELYVAMFSEVEKAIITVGEKVSASLDTSTLEYKNDKVSLTISGEKVELTANEIIFNGGGLGGFVKIQELESNLKAIKTFAEAIHAALPGAFNAVGAALASSGAAGATSYTGSMAGQSIKLSNMENTKVKH